MYVPNVDERMDKVKAALDRHPELNGDARTDVWNRCYEAVADALFSDPPKKEHPVTSALKGLNIIQPGKKNLDKLRARQGV